MPSCGKSALSVKLSVQRITGHFLVVRAQGPDKRNGEIGDTVESARPAFWPISLFLAVTLGTLAIVTGVRCSLLYSLWSS